MHNLTAGDAYRDGAPMRGSRTWTTSSGELGLVNDSDEPEDRVAFVQEYNRLAKKVCHLFLRWVHN